MKISKFKFWLWTIYDIKHLQELKVFLMGETQEKRLTLCHKVKKEIVELLEASKNERSIQEYRVKIIDLSKENKGSYRYELGSYDAIIGNNNGRIFVPIFHNADDYHHLPQASFDRSLPGIFSLSSKGWEDVHNPSKRDCYMTFE